ncbi:acyl-CoA thioesterase [Petropleomorpha daqingensis]|uniref:Acyl-CoA thioester hydrolase n=1 Tax=Petropleomorpha daqingensis TaxID=2026353 RepID=A0A853CHM4_9ACTN|nr:acyl-CoA thioester hydrolase [Petropleomorpha daqingensis]
MQLRWSDPDSYGHVNHARALGLLEDARLAMAAGSPSVAAGRQPDIILARLEVDYLRQLYYRAGERLCVRSWLTRIGTKSLTMRQELVQDDEVAIRLDAVLVVFDVAGDSSRPLTGEERSFWKRYLA